MYVLEREALTNIGLGNGAEILSVSDKEGLITSYFCTFLLARNIG